MPPADRDNFRAALQKTLLIKDINEFTLSPGQKKGNERHNEFPDPQDDQADPAQQNQKTKDPDHAERGAGGDGPASDDKHTGGRDG